MLNYSIKKCFMKIENIVLEFKYSRDELKKGMAMVETWLIGLGDWESGVEFMKEKILQTEK